MRIHTIHILSFGGLREREFTPGDGVNVYYGENETGKTSVAMFVKFMLYGLNPKPDTADGLSERIHFVNRETGQAAGWMTVETADGVIWRIERALIVTKEGTAKERVRIVNTKTSDVINGQNPGEYFFGLPEEDYTATCFVAQNVRLKPGTQSGTGLARAIETLNGNDAADEIETLEKRRAALVEAQTAPRADAAEIESLTASLDGINARIRELEADQAEYDELYDALCTINVPRRFEVAEKTRAELDELNRQMAELKALPFETHFDETVGDAERDLHAYEEEKAAYDEWKSTYVEPAESVGEIPDANEVIEETEHMASSFKAKTTFGVILFILGLTGLIAAFVMYSFNMDMYIFPLIGTLIAVTVGVILFIAGIRTRDRLKDRLREWNAESLDEFEWAVEEKIDEMERARDTQKESARRNGLLNSARLRADSAVAQLGGLLKTIGLDADDEDPYGEIETLRAAKADYIRERDELDGMIAKQQEKLALLEEQLGDTDSRTAASEADAVRETKSGQTAASLNTDGVRELKKKKDFTDSALRAAIGRRNTLTEKIAACRLTVDPDSAAAEIARIDERIAALRTQQNGRCDAGLSEKAAALVKSVVGAEEVGLIDGYLRGEQPTGYLSRGTADMTCLALRMALADEKFKAERPIAVMDESFAHIDGKRTGSMLTKLPDGQYLIFTCRQEEATAAKNAGIPVTVLRRAANA